MSQDVPGRPRSPNLPAPAVRSGIWAVGGVEIDMAVASEDFKESDKIGFLFLHRLATVEIVAQRSASFVFVPNNEPSEDLCFLGLCLITCDHTLLDLILLAPAS